MNFKDRVNELLKEEVLNEEIVKPTSKEKDDWKERQGESEGGILYLIIKDEKGKIKGYIDTQYVNKIRKEKGDKKLSPEAVAHHRLSQLELFKHRR
jgi:hypothetical protein